MRNTLAILVVVALVGAATAFAEIRRPVITGTAATTNVLTTLNTDLTRGILSKLTITLNGTAKTCTVVVVDADDGSLIASNTYASGTATITTNLAVVGLSVSTFSANTNALTVTVRPTLEQ